MKKRLLSATLLGASGALLTLGVAQAQTVKLGVGGYMEQVFGVTFDRDDAAGSGTGAVPVAVTNLVQHSENEVHFKGVGKLDNGIEILADIQLEAGGSPGQFIDEQYAIVRGNFGQVLVGMENNAGYLMSVGYSAWSADIGQHHVFDRGDWVQTPAGFIRNNGLTSVELIGPANDANQVSYFTPRFSGFQFGASYIPGSAQQLIPGSPTFPLKSGVAGTGATAAPGNVFNDGWAVGANYEGKFDNVTVGIGGGYMQMQPPTGDFDEFRQYVVAARVDVGPFRLAGGYNRTLDWDQSSTTSGKGDVFDVGVKYTFGPNAVSAIYTEGNVEGTIATPGDDEDTGFTLAYARTLAPGVKLTGTLLYSEYQDELTGPRSTLDGWAFASSIRLDF